MMERNIQTSFSSVRTYSHSVSQVKHLNVAVEGASASLADAERTRDIFKRERDTSRMHLEELQDKVEAQTAVDAHVNEIKRQ